MNTANLNSTVLAYESVGSGTPVLFIHGSIVADSFQPLLADEMLNREYRLINFHRRGYGESSSIPHPFSVLQQVEDCRSLMRFIGLEKAHVVGHSYGGVVALQLALDTPHLVHTLALLEPALVLGNSGDEYRQSLLSGINRYKEVGAVTVVNEFLAMRFGEGYEQPLEQIIPGAVEQAVADADTPFTVELPALVEWSFDKANATDIGRPVLCVLGKQSRQLSPRFAETHDILLKWLGDVEGFELPDAAHGLQMQNPQGMAEGLARFWRKHPVSG